MFGLKFKRQHPIAGLIVDFYCAELSWFWRLTAGAMRTRTKLLTMPFGRRTSRLGDFGSCECVTRTSRIARYMIC